MDPRPHPGSSLWAILGASVTILLLFASGCAPANQPLSPATVPASQAASEATTPAPPSPTAPATDTPTPGFTPLPTEAPSTTPAALPAGPSQAITPTLTSLHMVDEHTGWGLTYQAVLRTADGGAQWMDATPAGLSEPASLQGFFLDGNTAWLLAANGQDFFSGMLYRTGDAGKTWKSVKVPFSGGSLQFLDEQNGWALFATDCGAGSCGGSLYQTKDGGDTWTELIKIDQNSAANPKALPLAGNKTGIGFVNTQSGWATGVEPMDNYAWLFATQDGGRTWAHQTLDIPQGYAPAQLAIDPPRFFSAQDGLLPVTLFSGDKMSKVFYNTLDGGKTWTPTAPAGISGAYAFISTQDIWVWDGVTLMTTQDGGKTWDKVTPDVNLSQIILQIDFVSKDIGWVITMDADGKGQLLKTEDGGKTWSPA